MEIIIISVHNAIKLAKIAQIPEIIIAFLAIYHKTEFSEAPEPLLFAFVNNNILIFTKKP